MRKQITGRESCCKNNENEDKNWIFLRMKYRDERVGGILFGNTFRLCIRTYLVLASESSQFTSRSTLFYGECAVGEFMDAQDFPTTKQAADQLSHTRRTHVTSADNNYTWSNQGDEAHRNF